MPCTSSSVTNSVNRFTPSFFVDIGGSTKTNGKAKNIVTVPPQSQIGELLTACPLKVDCLSEIFWT